METSTDCFAIEFNDMKRQHQLLFGKDVIPPLVVDHTFYRAQVEHDLRAKLLRLRQKASGMLSDADLLRRLLLDSVSTFCVLFRHALILHGAEGPAAKREVIARASERFGFDPLPFEKLLAVREQQLKAREVEPVALLGAYLEAISVVIARRGSTGEIGDTRENRSDRNRGSGAAAAVRGRKVRQRAQRAGDAAGGSESAVGPGGEAMQRRADLIPNLVATVKGFAAHETEVFKDIADARAALIGGRTPQEKIAANDQLDGAHLAPAGGGRRTIRS